MSKEYSVKWTEPTTKVRVESARFKVKDNAKLVAKDIAADKAHRPVELVVHEVVRVWR